MEKKKRYDEIENKGNKSEKSLRLNYIRFSE